MPYDKVNRALLHVIYALAGLAAVLATGVLIWLTNPSDAYYRHVSTNVEQVDDGRWIATITRELPRGGVEGRWKLNVWVRRGEVSFTCAVPWSGKVTYRANRGPTVAYELPPEVQRCMRSAPPISLTWTRQMYLWGWVPLRPTEVTVSIDKIVVPSDRDM